MYQARAVCCECAVCALRVYESCTVRACAEYMYTVRVLWLLVRRACARACSACAVHVLYGTVHMLHSAVRMACLSYSVAGLRVCCR